MLYPGPITLSFPKPSLGGDDRSLAFSFVFLSHSLTTKTKQKTLKSWGQVVLRDGSVNKVLAEKHEAFSSNLQQPYTKSAGVHL